MKSSKLLSVMLGFGTIGLLSSVLAKVQGYVFPESLALFNNSITGSHDIVQYLIKLFCVYLSCFVRICMWSVKRRKDGNTHNGRMYCNGNWLVMAKCRTTGLVLDITNFWGFSFFTFWKPELF